MGTETQVVEMDHDSVQKELKAKFSGRTIFVEQNVGTISTLLEVLKNVGSLLEADCQTFPLFSKIIKVCVITLYIVLPD